MQIFLMSPCIVFKNVMSIEEDKCYEVSGKVIAYNTVTDDEVAKWTFPESGILENHLWIDIRKVKPRGFESYSKVFKITVCRYIALTKLKLLP